MSIASAISSAQTKVENAYTAVSNKGGTLPVTQDLSNLPTAIASIPTGGGSGVINSLSITPTTSAQTITASGGVDGYSPVSVAAVTSSIDANITAGNIKSGVSILGVTGNVVESNETTLSVTPTTSAQTLAPTGSYTGFDEVNVSAVDSSIDANITASNIKDGVSILGVVGNLEGLNATSLSVTPTTSAQTITPSSPYNGYDEVNVSAVTSSIDANITAGNIKDGVTILGVTGTYTGSISGCYRMFEKDANNKLTNSKSTAWIPLPTGTTDISDYCFANAYCNVSSSVLNGVINISSLTNVSGTYAMYRCFRDSPGITGVNASSLVSISGSNALRECFYGCTGITSVDFPMLQTLSGGNSLTWAFRGGINITTVNFPALQTVSGTGDLSYCFNGDAAIVSASFPLLQTISGQQGFYECFVSTGLIAVDFPSLSTITGPNAFGHCFDSCSNLARVSFYAASSFGGGSSQFNNMITNVTGCVVHFPIAAQSTISSWTSVINGFGGTNTTVIFDIVTSLTGADSNTYTRQQKDSTSTATAWVYNDTLYYTSGVTEPSVNNTIYSDSACTTSVTTVSAIG